MFSFSTCETVEPVVLKHRVDFQCLRSTTKFLSHKTEILFFYCSTSELLNKPHQIDGMFSQVWKPHYLLSQVEGRGSLVVLRVSFESFV